MFLGTQKDNVHDCANKGRRNKDYTALLNRFGDKNGNAKLTEEEAKAILLKLKYGLRPKQAAKMHGVTVGAIYHLRSGFTWPNLAHLRQ